MARSNGRPPGKHVRIYPRGKDGWLYADLRKWGGERTVLRNPEADGWPDLGERTTDRAVAEAWVTEYLRKLHGPDRGQLAHVVDRPLAAAVEEYLAEREITRSPATLVNDRTALGGLLSAFPGVTVCSITPAMVQRRFDTLLREGIQPSTLAGRLTALRTFFGWAGVHPNPAQSVELPTVDRGDVYIPSDQELEWLRRAASNVDRMNGPGSQARLALELALATGAREQELFAIRWEDFQPGDRTVLVRRQLARRGRGARAARGRTVRAVYVLDAWWEGYYTPGATGYVLHAGAGEPVGPGVRHALIQSIYDAARLNAPGRGWSTLRYRYAMDFLRRTGGAIGALADTLGVSRRTAEETYEHLYHEREAEEAARREPGQDEWGGVPQTRGGNGP